MSDDATEGFEAAVRDVQELPNRPDNDTLLKLYALYKQATQGDVDGRRPGMLDLRGRAKYDAWAMLQGMSTEDARDEYVALVDQLRNS